jgi:hypothetical protein
LRSHEGGPRAQAGSGVVSSNCGIKTTGTAASKQLVLGYGVATLKKYPELGIATADGCQQNRRVGLRIVGK